MSVIWHSCTESNWFKHECKSACGVISANLLHGKERKNTRDVNCIACLHWLIEDERKSHSETYQRWSQSCPSDD